MSESARGWGITAAVAGLMIAAVAGAWLVMRPEPLPDAAEAERVEEDLGPEMDLEHLKPEDLAFLAEVLDNGIPEGRRSAARALVVSGDLRGVPVLFGQASGEDSAFFCLAALEILRLQDREDTLRELILAMERSPSLEPGCMSEVSDRFAIVGGRDPASALGFVEDEEPALRAWAAQRLAQGRGEDYDEALLALTRDPDPAVRRRSWMAWSDRERSAVIERELRALAEQESAPDLKARALEALE